MTIDGKDAERIAKDLIREIASEWVNTPTARCIEENGTHIFEFTLQPGTVIRYARQVERPIATSIFRFDPLAEATEIVMSVAFTYLLHMNPPIDMTMTDLILRNNAKPRINQMLISAPDVLRDAMWQARIIGETLYEIEVMRLFGRPDIGRGLVNSAVAMIENKLRERFGKIPQKQKPKISSISIVGALSKFFPQFKETGQLPSQRQFAIALGVTPKGWRTYLDRNHLGNHESFVKARLDRLLTKENS
jgi:hypothetical protein